MSARRIPRVVSLVVLCSTLAVGVASAQVVVKVDPRIELMSVVFRLAGNQEYQNGRVASYTRAVDEHFGKFRDHAVVKRARFLRRKYGVSYDACMSMAIHIVDATKLAEAIPFDGPRATLDKRWRAEDARAFLVDARRFVKKSRFAAFVRKHRKLYTSSARRLQKLIDAELQLDWFGKFFGAKQGAGFVVVLGMLNGGANYGPHLRKKDGREDLYCVLGVWATDDEGKPRFDSSMLGTVVHEFCHSYCNPLVDRHAGKLEKAGGKMFPIVADTMRSQAYGTWQTMMYESLVRASVVRYQAHVGGEAARKKQIDQEHRRGFTWVGGLSDLLAEYEAKRGEFKTLDAFFPRIVAYFDTAAQELVARDEQTPKVVSLSPGNGATDVDPGTTEIVVTFDVPMMDRMWSFVGGGPHFPKTTGKPRYDAARKVLRLPVKLKPDWRYEFWLNRGKYNTFRSADGVPLRPVRVRFKTKG